MHSLKRWYVDAFPPPDFLTMPAAALDISPNSIKYLEGDYTSAGCALGSFQEVFLRSGVIVDGKISDMEEFVNSLKKIREVSEKEFLHISIPENSVYLYSVTLKDIHDADDIMYQIEFSFNEHVPVSINEVWYDFDIVNRNSAGVLVSVTAAPRQVVSEYERAVISAGFFPKAIELETYAVARSVSDKTHENASGIVMIIDMGYSRASIIIAKNGIPIFSITVPGGSKSVSDVVSECKAQYMFWDTRTNSRGKRIDRVKEVLVTGGSGRLILEPLKRELQVDIKLANVWRNLFDTDMYIPAIHEKESHSMATLAGLLLKNKE